MAGGWAELGGSTSPEERLDVRLERVTGADLEGSHIWC